jgi:hypothetical protein
LYSGKYNISITIQVEEGNFLHYIIDYSAGDKLMITSWGRQKKRIRGEFPRSRPMPRETNKYCPGEISVKPDAQFLGTADKVKIGPNPGI